MNTGVQFDIRQTVHLINDYSTLYSVLVFDTINKIQLISNITDNCLCYLLNRATTTTCLLRSKDANILYIYCSAGTSKRVNYSRAQAFSAPADGSGSGPVFVADGPSQSITQLV